MEELRRTNEDSLTGIQESRKLLTDGKDKHPTLVNASSPISEAIERNFLIETRSLPLSLAVTLTALP
jgi:hypothetical protein